MDEMRPYPMTDVDVVISDSEEMILEGYRAMAEAGVVPWEAKKMLHDVVERAFEMLRVEFEDVLANTDLPVEPQYH